MAAAAKKPDPEQHRLALARELVGIHIKHRADFGRADELKTELKKIATDEGNFREVIAGQGKVSVAGEKEQEFLGNVPEIVPEKFNALSAAEQRKLVRSGLVQIVPSYKAPYYGRVKVDLF